MELCHKGAITRYREGVVGIGRNLVAILSPSQEGVSCGSRGCHRATLAIVVAATTRNTTSTIRVGRDVYRVALGLELCHKGAITRHREGVVGIGRNLVAVLCPSQEGVSCGSRGRHSTTLAMIISAAATNRAAITWTG